MDRDYLGIPDGADKLLFAEDLVSFIATDIFDRPYEGSRASPFRAFIRNAFNKTVKVAVHDVTNRLRVSKAPFFNMMQDEIQANEGSYLELVRNLQDYYSSEGFDAKNFILYSCEVTITALFFKNLGLDSALDIAVTSIFEFLKDYDMLSTGWDTLNLLASHLEKLQTDSANLLTPESQSTSSADSGDEHELVNVSCAGERDSAPQNKEDSGSEAEENKDESQINMADLRDVFTANKDISTKSLEMPSTSKSKDLPQHSGNFHVVMHDEKKYTKEMLITDTTDDVFVTGGIDFEKLQMSSVSAEDKTFQIVKSCQEICGEIQASTSNTKSEAEVNLSDVIGPSTLIDMINSEIRRKFLALKTDKIPLLDIFEEQNSNISQSLASKEDKVTLLDSFDERNSTSQKSVALTEDTLLPVNTSDEYLKPSEESSEGTTSK